MSANFISSPDQRRIRSVEKEVLVMRFLRQHIWSTQEILQLVLGLSSRQATHKTLTKIEEKGYLRRHTYQTLGGKITIWGITSQGQTIAFNVENESLISTYFEPNRISEQTIHHQLDIQKLRLKAEIASWINWIDGDRLGAFDKNQKRPDAIALDCRSKRVAIECERTFKSLKRYEQILVEYLKLIKIGQIDNVVWVCPTLEMAARLRKIFRSFTSVRVNGQQVLIEPERHHTNIYFCSYEQWPNYE